MSIPDAFWLLFAMMVSAAVVIDARVYRIPNKLTIAIAVLGVIFLAATAPHLILTNVAVALGALAIGFGLFRFAAFGAGDAKLFAAVMVWLGVSGIMPLLFWFGIACAILVVILLIGRAIEFPEGSALGNWRPFQKRAPVPLALAIGPAAIAAAAYLVLGG